MREVLWARAKAQGEVAGPCEEAVEEEEEDGCIWVLSPGLLLFP